MHGFVASIVQAVFPVVNEILENRERVLDLYRRANKLILAIVVFTVTNFIGCGSLFLKLWVSQELASASYHLLVLHGLTFGVIAIGIMAFQLAEVFKFPALNVIMTGSWMILAIPMMIVAAGYWQSEGVAGSRLAAAMVTFPIVAYTEQRFLGNIQWRFWTAVGVRIGIAAASMGLAEWFILRSLGDSYVSLFAAGGVGTIVFGSVLAATGFLTREDREMIRRNLDFRKRFV
jgi:hypothetical protein